MWQFGPESGFSDDRYRQPGWDEEILHRTAEALYLWWRPKQSWNFSLVDLNSRSLSKLLLWSEEFLDAAFPDGEASNDWDVEAAAEVCYRMKHEGCMYFDSLEARWPQVGHWYEHMAETVLDAAVFEEPVDNTHVLPDYLKQLSTLRS